MVLWRFSICQLCAAPLEITSTTASISRPAARAKLKPSDRPCTTPAMQIWLTILVSWPAPAGPSSAHLPGIGRHHRLGPGIGGLAAAAHDGELAVHRARLAARDRRIDEIEARRLRRRRQLARDGGRRRGVIDEQRALASSRRRRRLRPASLARKSASRPTQAEHDIGILAPLRPASAAVAPPYSPAHLRRARGVRLKTVTSWPARWRWPAIG